MDARTEKRKAFIINTAYIALVVALVVLAFKYLVPWLLPIIIGYAIAMIFKPIVQFIVKHTKAGPKFTGCVVLLLAYALIAALLVLGGSKLVGTVQNVLSDIPTFYTANFQPAILSISNFFVKILEPLMPGTAGSSSELVNATLQNVQNVLLSFSSSAIAKLGTLTTKIPAFMLAFFFTIMSSLIISMNYAQVAGFLARQIPEEHRQLIFLIKNDTLKTVGNYMIAYLKLMGVTFVELAIGLTVLRVNNSIPIALGIAIFDALPVLGTGGIMVPWIAIALLNGKIPLAVGLAILYAIILVVRNIIEPRIVGNQLGLHPLVTLSAIYAGFKLMGVMGMILFPILVQILAGLHHSKVIRLWQD
ncbi:MAG TPA: sporulation integral membrane protein YtvI [Clostridiales bacterium]|nr:sporulation integral membrane protein YtvI [Clostridiales bacterium]